MSKDIDYHRKDYSINIDFQNFALKNAFKGILENDEYYKSLDLKCEIVVINSIAKDCTCHLQKVFELLKIHSSQIFTLK
jgi:hypothetical protein